ncbi:MAG: hypothetical protein FJ290_24800 [Planctomycetes bacterium]|nr:hypothetical protein [Planctomycetota bacterium]
MSGPLRTRLSIAGVISIALIALAGLIARTAGALGAAEQPTTGTLKVTIVDESGKPLPARVHLCDAEGRYLFAAGQSSRQRAVYKGTQPIAGDWFYAVGAFSIDVAPGNAIMDIAHGPAFATAHEVVPIVAGKTTEKTCTLRRLIDLAAAGWYSADEHLHQPPDSLLMLAEDLNLAATPICGGVDLRYRPDQRLTQLPDATHLLVSQLPAVELDCFLWNLTKPLALRLDDQDWPIWTTPTAPRAWRIWITRSRPRPGRGREKARSAAESTPTNNSANSSGPRSSTSASTRPGASATSVTVRATRANSTTCRPKNSMAGQEDVRGYVRAHELLDEYWFVPRSVETRGESCPAPPATPIASTRSTWRSSGCSPTSSGTLGSTSSTAAALLSLHVLLIGVQAITYYSGRKSVCIPQCSDKRLACRERPQAGRSRLLLQRLPCAHRLGRCKLICGRSSSRT